MPQPVVPPAQLLSFVEGCLALQYALIMIFIAIKTLPAHDELDTCRTSLVLPKQYALTRYNYGATQAVIAFASRMPF